MEPVERELDYYHMADGRVPYWDWYRSLRDTKTRETVNVRLARVRVGNFGHCEPVGEGVVELKIDYGSGYRVYLGQVGLRMVFLLTGGDKYTQDKDIRKAKVFWHDYQARHR